MEVNMNTQTKSIKKSHLFLAILALAAAAIACNFASPQPQAYYTPPPEGEPQIPAEEPRSGEAHIVFNTERSELRAGECTALHWNVEGGFGVMLNGQGVDFSGSREVCPGETTAYRLAVDQGDRVNEAEVVIHVMENPGEPPVQQPPAQGQPPQQQPQQQQPPTSQPPQQPPQQPTQKPTPTQQKPFSADIAVTDLYAGNLPYGQVHIRITNNGSGTLTNVTVNVLCSVTTTQTGPGSSQSGTFMAPFSVTLNMSPGITQSFPTGITLDTNTFTYSVGCTVQPGFNDPNSGNNSHSEKIP
jgi:cell division septation protein DedD